ncbi:response regulator transcription factor [Serratia aquatilis]|uniref:Response regulator transcription factor n=1 Tax=Serratia aquatilis TaxID=1737515 RepID=A0ABV6EEN1_9GAMM
MKSPIIIGMWDNDHFFIQGMQHILNSYFHAKGNSVVFMTFNKANIVDLMMVDLIIKSTMSWENVGCERHKIVIARKNESGEEGLFRRLGEINRREKPEAMFRLLDKLFTSSSSNQVRYHTTGIGISSREHDVLRGIAAELTHHQIAKRLQISTKTVSAHKHAAMRKLGFKSTHELYNWLLQDGVTCGGELGRIPQLNMIC